MLKPHQETTFEVWDFLKCALWGVVTALFQFSPSKRLLFSSVFVAHVMVVCKTNTHWINENNHDITGLRLHLGAQ
jgi:hypothetical protein